MSTRSKISVKINDSTFKTIYCHWDGYLKGVGETLLHHFTSLEKINELMSLGDVSSLKEDVIVRYNINHTFDNPDENTTVFYGRDRGDKGTECIVVDKESKLRLDVLIQYYYLFKDGKWYFKTSNKTKFMLLTDKEIEKDL